MRHLMRHLVVAAAICLGAGKAAHAIDPAPPPQTAPIATTAASGAAPVRAAMHSAARGPAAAPSNLDPVRGPVATNPHAYPYDAIGMQPYHTWNGYSPN